MAPDISKRKRKISRKGWKPTLDEDGNPSRYQQENDRRLDDLEEDPNFENLTKILHDSTDHDSAEKVSYFRRPEKSPELLHLLSQRRIARDPRERKRLSKDIHKMARKETRKWRTLWTDHLLE